MNVGEALRHQAHLALELGGALPVHLDAVRVLWLVDGAHQDVDLRYAAVHQHSVC